MLQIGLVSRTPDYLYGDMVLALCKANVDFIICGGVAAIIHGVPRNTFDLDISLNLDPENVRRFLSCVQSLGLVPKMPVSPDSLLEQQALQKMAVDKGAIVFSFLDPQSPLRHIDVFLTKELSYEELKQHVITDILDGHTVKVLSAKYLLKLKLNIQPPRQKDWLDIQHLDKMLRDRDDSG